MSQLSLRFAGLHCALLAGVPEEVIKRASYILDVTERDEHVERLCNDQLLLKDQNYKDAVQKLMAFDAVNGDLNVFFQAMCLF
uniref:Uncharacterized protein n=1 Tax=Kalanchoe fedtschenkoi TaxID=63787 RepID=A0A7N0VGJ2_KALFE